MTTENTLTPNSSPLKIILFCILLSAGILVLRNLGHSKLTFFDESFHAIVARNLKAHPLKFTLYDQPWLQYDYKNWEENHIWLHKPPIALWLISISHFLLGINAFALRFPSAIGLVLSAWLTYKIASELFDKRAGVIAAFFQAFNPFLFESVHGYRYSDHIDISLLLWVQVSCWFLLRAIQTGQRKHYILSGIAMGIAYLSKSYFALITFGVAFVIWFVGWVKRKKRVHTPQTYEPETQIRIKDVGLQFLTGCVTVLPWTLYTIVKYPKEFLWEQKRILDHLNTSVEGWGSSWDRPLFDYMPLFYPLFYAALLAAVLCLLVLMFKHWRLSELFVLAWSIGVIVPLTCAHTKTPSATLIAVPPLLICFATVISKSWQHRDWFYTTMWGAAMLSVYVIQSGHTLDQSANKTIQLNTFAPFVQANFWIISQLLAFGVLFALLTGVHLLIRKKQWQKWIWISVRVVALVITLSYAGRYVYAAYKVTETNAQNPVYVKSGERIQTELPPNACFFLDDENIGAHFDLMYYADRSIYQISNIRMKTPRNIAKQAREARAAGAIPYLFSVKRTKYDYPLLIEGEVDIGGGRKQRYRIFEITDTQHP